MLDIWTFWNESFDKSYDVHSAHILFWSSELNLTPVVFMALQPGGLPQKQQWRGQKTTNGTIICGYWPTASFPKAMHTVAVSHLQCRGCQAFWSKQALPNQNQIWGAPEWVQPLAQSYFGVSCFNWAQISCGPPLYVWIHASIRLRLTQFRQHQIRCCNSNTNVMW